MERVLDILDKLATPRNLVIAIIASGSIVAVMGTLTQTMVYDIYGDADMPDTKLWYSYDDIQQAFSTLGPEGLQVWLQVHSLDLLFPLAYGFAITFGLLMELRAVYPEKKRLRAVALLSLFASAADYVENFLVANQAVAYPNLSHSVIAVASAVTTTKWILLYISFALVFVLIPVVVYRRFRQ